jgi:hypothetical protein
MNKSYDHGHGAHFTRASPLYYNYNQWNIFQCDQQKEGIANTPAKMDEYCKENGFSGWYETSAKENINIDDAARFLVSKVYFINPFLSQFINL